MAITATFDGFTFHVGDTIKVYYKIVERDVVSGKTKKEKHEEKKERLQAFEGIVIAIRGNREGKSFIVRHIGVGNIGVERIFPLITPWIKKITLKKKGHERRAKLYYLRNKTAKDITKVGELVKEELVSKTLKETPKGEEIKVSEKVTPANEAK